jgi:hypothetical protein
LKGEGKNSSFSFELKRMLTEGMVLVDFRDDAKSPVSATATRHAVSPISFFPFSHYVVLLISRYHDNQHTLQDTAWHAGIMWHQVSPTQCLQMLVQE